MKITKAYKTESYDYGRPGWHSSVQIRVDGQLVAFISYPNVNGPACFGFIDLKAGIACRQTLADGEVTLADLTPFLKAGLIRSLQAGKITFG